MMLRYSLNQPEGADAIEAAVQAALDDGFRTSDIAGGEGVRVVKTEEFGQIVAERVTNIRIK